jgi:hypothetical protein
MLRRPAPTYTSTKSCNPSVTEVAWKAIVDAGIAVMGHAGLTPQTSASLGGLRCQGKSTPAALALLEDALALQEAGSSVAGHFSHAIASWRYIMRFSSCGFTMKCPQVASPWCWSVFRINSQHTSQTGSIFPPSGLVLDNTRVGRSWCSTTSVASFQHLLALLASLHLLVTQSLPPDVGS